MIFRINKLHEDTILPEKKSIGAAGYDLHAYTSGKDVIIQPGETQLIPLGFKTAFDSIYVALIYARSGLACKEGLAPANKVGVIDSDYRGEWKVALHNHGNEVKTVHHGDRIAQVVFERIESPAFIVNDSIDDTARAEGGFNSTGTN